MPQCGPDCPRDPLHWHPIRSLIMTYFPYLQQNCGCPNYRGKHFRQRAVDRVVVARELLANTAPRPNHSRHTRRTSRPKPWKAQQTAFVEKDPPAAFEVP